MSLQCLVRGGRINLCAQVGSRRAACSKIAGEHWLDEGAKDDLSTTEFGFRFYLCLIEFRIRDLPSLGKSKPKSKDKLERVVEWEPVNGADCTLKDTKFKLARYFS